MSGAAAEIQENLELGTEQGDSEPVTQVPDSELHTENGRNTASDVEYTPDNNPELTEFLKESTTTKAEFKEAEKQQQGRNDLENQPEASVEGMGHDGAMVLAIGGLDKWFGFISAKSGAVVDLPNEAKMVVAALVAPVILKHEKTIKRYLSADNIDLDSNMPEVMAATAVFGVGGYTLYSIKSAKKIETDTAEDEGEADGDQPEHG